MGSNLTGSTSRPALKLRQHAARKPTQLAPVPRPHFTPPQPASRVSPKEGTSKPLQAAGEHCRRPLASAGLSEGPDLEHGRELSWENKGHSALSLALRSRGGTQASGSLPSKGAPTEKAPGGLTGECPLLNPGSEGWRR